MIGLYFGGQWFQTYFGNDYGNIELDASLEEDHEWSAEATRNPVEEGSPVTDHVIEKQDKLKIRGFITDTPINLSQSVSGTMNGFVTGNRTQAAFDLLNKLIKAREPVSVYTKHAIYDDMILEEVRIPRAPGQGEALEFVAEFVHIRKVSTQVVDVPKGISAKRAAKGDSSTAKKADPQKDGGKKQAETVKKPSSTLARIFN